MSESKLYTYFMKKCLFIKKLNLIAIYLILRISKSKVNFIMCFKILYIICSLLGNIEQTDREIRIKISKKEPDWWPRLLFDSKEIRA